MYKLGLCLLCLAMPLWASKPQLKLGFFELPPHGYQRQGIPDGTAIAYLKLVLADAGLDAQAVELPLARLLAGNDTELIAYAAKNPEREAKLVYSRYPFFCISSSITVKRNASLQIVRSTTDLIGLKIGIWSQGYVHPMLRDTRLTLDAMPGQSDVIQRNLKKVLLGRIDGFYSPDIAAVDFVAKQMGYADDLRQIELPNSKMPIYLAFSTRLAPQLRQKIETAFYARGGYQGYEQFRTGDAKRKLDPIEFRQLDCLRNS